eukprot:2974448-Pyramimonas_sp.AAC.1
MRRTVMALSCFRAAPASSAHDLISPTPRSSIERFTSWRNRSTPMATRAPDAGRPRAIPLRTKHGEVDISKKIP